MRTKDPLRWVDISAAARLVTKMTNSSKIVLWILLIAAIATSALWIMGGKRNEYSSALVIDADPPTVFSFLVEPEKLKGWVKGLSRVEQIEPNEEINGILVVNTQSRTVVVDGKATLFEDEVLRFGEDTNLTVKSTNSKIALTSIFKLEPQDNRTLLTYRVKTLNRGIGRLLAPLSKDETQSRIDEELRRLKELVESDSSESTLTDFPDGDDLPDEDNQ